MSSRLSKERAGELLAYLFESCGYKVERLSLKRRLIGWTASGTKPGSVGRMAALERSLGIKPPPEHIGTEAWLRERFPEKDWHRHPRTGQRWRILDYLQDRFGKAPLHHGHTEGRAGIR